MITRVHEVYFIIIFPPWRDVCLFLFLLDMQQARLLPRGRLVPSPADEARVIVKPETHGRGSPEYVAGTHCSIQTSERWSCGFMPQSEHSI